MNQNRRIKAVLIAAACAVCVDWTRFVGRVKKVDLQNSAVTIENNDGDILTVPYDYQVTIFVGDEPVHDLKALVQVKRNAKITLTRTPQEKPVSDNDMTGMAQPEHPEPGQRGK